MCRVLQSFSGVHFAKNVNRCGVEQFQLHSVKLIILELLFLLIGNVGYLPQKLTIATKRGRTTLILLCLNRTSIAIQSHIHVIQKPNEQSLIFLETLSQAL